MIVRYAIETAEFIHKAQENSNQRDFWLAQASRTLKTHTKMSFRKARDYVRELMDYSQSEAYEQICSDFVWTKQERLDAMRENYDQMIQEASELKERILNLEQEILEENVK